MQVSSAPGLLSGFGPALGALLHICACRCSWGALMMGSAYFLHSLDAATVRQSISRAPFWPIKVTH